MRIFISSIFFSLLISIIFFICNDKIFAENIGLDEINIGVYENIEYFIDNDDTMKKYMYGNMIITISEDDMYYLSLYAENKNEGSSCGFNGKCLKVGKEIRCFPSNSNKNEYKYYIQYVQVKPNIAYIADNLRERFCGHKAEIQGTYKKIK